VNGKTVTKTLNKDQAAAVKKAIKELNEGTQIIERWKALSLKEVEKM
jgi:hypothetical protein